MDEKRTNYLLTGFARNNLSREEREELLSLLQRDTNGEVLGDNMQKIVDQLVREGIIDDVPSQQIWEVIRSDPRLKKSRVKQPRGNYSFFYYAAAIALFVIFLGAYFFHAHDSLDSTQNRSMTSSNAKGVTRDTISPGIQQATLTLPDGKVIALADLTENTVVKGDNYEISLVEGKIQYKGQNDNHTPLMTTLTTPRGGEYQLRLPDGTNVWLNASSSIRYPIRFAENARNVYIEGEAYLEVKKDAEKPFIVQADQTKITVLGTEFNISAYPEQKEVLTTLIEGSVRLQKGETSRQLYPGQQARISKGEDEHIVVQSVDTEEVIAWKNGYFYFNNENIKSAMAKIARWYDVDVVYTAVPQQGLDGTISRLENLQQLLQALELTGAAKFTLEGRRIVVSE